MSAPWMKFYPSAWRADPALRMCSIGARGLWAEMLCLMHEADPRGHLLINGNTVTDQHLAVLCGVPLAECRRLIKELEAAGVFSRDGGAIVSRRMCRDTAKAEEDKANGGKGGNPTLKAGVNPPNNGSDKAKNLEARVVSSGSKEPSESRPKRKGVSYTPEFENFWKGYPSHENQSKSETFDAWRKLPSEEQTLALASLPQFSAYCRNKPDYPVVHAVRYLSKRRFEGHAVQTAQPLAENRTTWVTDDDPRWPALAARYAADHGRSLSPISSKHAAGLGWHFPNEWLAESERAA
jgi:hypothetical protein